METLTIENAKNVSTIQSKNNPEWGRKRFTYDYSKDKFHSRGVGSNSAVLFESEFKFWNVVSYKKAR